MGQRTNITSNSPLESIFGYSRAVKVGDQVFVSGTTAIQPDGTLIGEGDAYAQTVAALRTIVRALDEVGATAFDVVRTRVFLTNMDDLPAVSQAHRETFGDVLPASTAVEVSRFTRPPMLVEIEADAIIGTAA